MADVLFKGYFDLATALNEFGKFCKDVEFRLKKVYENVNQDKQAAGFGVFGTTRGDVQKAEKEIKGAQDRIGNGFINLAIRSYALHQVGNLLQQAVTQPLINLGREVAAVTLRFDTLEKLLTERGGKSISEVGATIDLVGRVAKLRNLDLETSVTLYSRLFEATRGAIDDQLFETLAKGLSQVMTTIESGEKRAFFGQIQDVLGGGNVANLERTLSLAPALKTVYDEIQRESTEALTDQELLIQSFTRLGNLPALTDLATKVKNIRVEFELMAYRIGQIYKDEFEEIIDFLTNRVIPAIDSLLTKLENAPEIVQNLIAVGAGLAAILAPIISTLGTLILLFPSATAEAAFVGKILSFLARIPALLNPISAIVLALVAILTKAFGENAGGFRDAITYLMDILSTTFWNALKNIYETLSSIVAIFVNFYNLIDSIIPLTATIGAIGTGLAYIFAQALALINLVAIIPAALRFIADILAGDFDIAFARITVNLLKIMDSLGPIARLMELIFGGDVKEDIKKAEAELARLDKTQKSLADHTGLTKEQQDELKLAFEQNANSIKKITEAIEEQTEAIDEQILKNRQMARERSQQLENYIAQARQQNYSDVISDADLTSAAGKDAARDALGSFNVSVEMQAESQRTARIQKGLRDFFQKQRETILKSIEKETTESGEKLDKDTKELYINYANLLKQAVFGDVDITDENASAFIFDVLKKQVTKSKGNEQQLRLLFAFIQNERALFEQVHRGEQINLEERIKAAQAIGEKKKQLEKAIEKANAEAQQTREATPVRRAVGRLDNDIERMEQRMEDYHSLADKIINLKAFVENLANLEGELIALENKRAEKLRELARIEGQNQADIDEEISKIDAELDQRIDAIKDSGARRNYKLYEKIIGDEIEQRQKLNGLLEQLQDLRRQRVDIGREAGTVNEADIQKYNDSLDVLFFGLTEDKLTRLKRLVSIATPILNDLPGKVAEPLRASFKALADTTQDQLLTASKRQEMIAQADGIIEILKGYLSLSGQIDDSKRAQIQLFINAYVQLVQAIKDGSDILSQRIDKAVELNIARQGGLERELELVEATERELELTREILELRRKSGDIQVGNLKNLGKQILDVLSGGRLSDYEIEKQIIEQKIAAARLELEIAVLRLQIELEILVTKMRAAGTSEAEIQKVRDQYGQLIDKLKEEGELRRILLEEQLKGLTVFAGTFGDMLFQGIALALEKLFKTKDEPKVTAIGDDGEEIELDKPDDPLADQADSADEASDSLENLDKKYKKIAGTVGVVAKAILAMNDLSIKSIRNAVAEALNAIAQEALVRALQYAAIALSALVFGDYQTAAKAGIAAAAWGAVAVAAKLGADLIGTADGQSAANSQASSSRSAGVNASGDYDPDRDPAILKQKAVHVIIQMDIRTDNGQIIKTHVAALNQNTELTNLTMNQQEGWAFSPTV